MEGVRNREFYNLCSDFINQLIKLPDFTNQRLPQNRDIEYVFFLFKLENKVSETEAYLKIEKYMESDPIISKHLNEPVGIWSRTTTHTAWTFISYLIKEQLYVNEETFSLNEDKFLESYSHLEDFFYEDKFKMRASLRLINFTSEQNEIRLSEDIIIKKMDESDSRLFPNKQFFHPRNSFIIEHVYDLEKKIGKLDPEIIPENKRKREEIITGLHLVVDIFRLFKQGDIMSGEFYQSPLHNIIELGSSHVSFLNTDSAWFNTYELKDDEVSDFLAFWKEYERGISKNYREFNISLRRLGLACERYRHDDRIIDLVIALESLLFTKEEKTELTYRLRLRLAKLLETDIEKRKLIMKKVNEIYRHRSKIVHGGSYPIDVKLCDACEALLRRGLVAYFSLRKQNTHNKIIEGLDVADSPHTYLG